MLNEKSEIVAMTFLRKLEVACRIATGLLGLAAATQMLHADIETMRRLERTFPVVQEIIGAFALYVIPGFIVAVGSYLQVYRLRTWGFPMTVIGSFFLV